VREIDRQLLYSAAWLDDGYPDSEPDSQMRALHALQQRHPDAIGACERRSTRPEVRPVTGEQTSPVASNPVAWLGERLRDRVERRGAGRLGAGNGLFWVAARGPVSG